VRPKQLEGILRKAPGQFWKARVRVALVAEGSEAVKNKAKHLKRMQHEAENIMTGISIQNAKDENYFKIHSINHGRAALAPMIRRETGNWLRPTMKMAANEVPGFWHLPNVGNLTNTMMILAQRLPPPGDLPVDKHDHEVSILGQTHFRSQHIQFGMLREDRLRHVLVTGTSGMGKLQLMQHFIRSDFENGFGAGILDPDGRLFDQALKLVPKHRIDDVVIFDPEDVEFPAGLNPFELVDEGSRMRVASGLLEMFRLRFTRQWSDRIEHLLYFTIYALLSTQWTTVLSMRRMLTDPVYRNAVISNTRDRVVKEFL
jgi:hypothetical protein